MINFWITEKYTAHQYFGIGGWGDIETYVSSPTESVVGPVDPIPSGNKRSLSFSGKNRKMAYNGKNRSISFAGKNRRFK